jgi:rhodanese-related sulfurtransferase
MSTRLDYGQIAAKTDYAVLDKKLAQLAEREPPKNRKTAGDILEPLRERLLTLHRTGWSSQQLAQELKAAGVPVSPARLRECLNQWTTGGNGSAKRREGSRGKRTAARITPPPTTSLGGRSRSTSGDGQTKFGLSQD